MTNKILIALLAILASAAGVCAQQTVLAVGGVLTIDASQGNHAYKVPVSAAITSVVIVNPSPGEHIAITFQENATGGFAVTFGGNIAGACVVSTIALASTACPFDYDQTANTWNGSGSSSGSSSPSAWDDGGGVIIPFVATDSETMEESTWLYEGNCQILTTLTNCYKTWHSVGWNTTGMSYAECPSLPSGAPGVCSRLIAGAPFTTIGTGALGGRSRGFVFHNGATYYMFVCGATCGTMDVWSSATGKDDFVLVQAAILSVGGVGIWDHTTIFNPYVWIEGTTWKMIYTGDLAGAPYGLGYATCSSACPGGTWTKDAGNPFITSDATNTGGYGNAELKIINNQYWLWAHSSGTLATLLPSDVYRWSCGNSGAAQKPTSCTQTPLGKSTFPRQTTDEGASGLVGQVADVSIVERLDLGANGKVVLFLEGDLDGTQLGGMEHLKYAIAEMPLASLIRTNEGRLVTPDNISLNSLAIAAHTPPGLGMISVGNSNSSLAFKAGNPTCNMIYMAGTAATDFGGLFCNHSLVPGTPPSLSAPIATGFSTGRFQFNISNANASAGFLVGIKNTAGTESFPLQGYFNTGGNLYDVLPQHIGTGQAPTLTGTGSCATFAAQSGNWVGSFQCTGATAASTVTITFAAGTGVAGWNCVVQDETTRANLLQQTSHSANTAVLTATSVTQNDVFTFHCHGW